jgi:hypothetical protein
MTQSLQSFSPLMKHYKGEKTGCIYLPQEILEDPSPSCESPPGGGPSSSYGEGPPGGGPSSLSCEGPPAGGPSSPSGEGPPGGGPSSPSGEGSPGRGPSSTLDI